MKKNGFTLVELLGVIVLVALISLIVMPKITERFNQKQVEASEMAKEVLYAATREYITSNQYVFNTGDSYYCVAIDDLIADGKLVSPVIDPSTGSPLSGSATIEVSVQNNQYHFAYDTDNCSSALELIPSSDKSTLTIRVKSSISVENLPTEPYSFDNGVTWQSSNEYQISSYYSNIIKIRNKKGDTSAIPLSIGKLTINANEGIWNSLNENSIFWLNKDEGINIPNPIRTKYLFLNWSGLEGTGSTIENKIFKMGNSDTTLIANWKLINFTLTVDPNGGLWEGDLIQYLNIGDQTNIENPTNGSYYFDGWQISNDSSLMLGNILTMGEADTTITAKWKQFTISDYTYTGTSELIDDGDGNWRIKFLTNGTLSMNYGVPIDVFLVGGGGGGGNWGSGGGGGYTKTTKGIDTVVGTDYPITIGWGGAHHEGSYYEEWFSKGGGDSGGPSTAFGQQANGGGGGRDDTDSTGGNGGSGGGSRCGEFGGGGQNGGDGGSTYDSEGWLCASGGIGQHTTTREFEEPDGKLYASGAGPSGKEGAPNTGDGGSGSNGYHYGGSGIVIIRNHRE